MTTGCTEEKPWEIARGEAMEATREWTWGEPVGNSMWGDLREGAMRE